LSDGAFSGGRHVRLHRVNDANAIGGRCADRDASRIVALKRRWHRGRRENACGPRPSPRRTERHRAAPVGLQFALIQVRTWADCFRAASPRAARTGTGRERESAGFRCRRSGAI